MNKDKVFLVDVSAMYFRAFYAIRSLSNSKGMPTNALYGFLSMTQKLLADFDPEYLCFCFDRKEPSFRLNMYSEYKANRTEMPEELQLQVPFIEPLTKALGIPRFELKNYEADDCIGMLTKFAKEKGLEVVIVSGDKDFAQLVDKDVQLYDPMRDNWFDEKGVVEKWGVQASQMIDYLSIVGDSSDNIPGVKGIGAKGAQKLLSEYKNLEEIYSRIDQIANKSMQKKLQESKKNAFLSRDLIEIVTENKLGVSSLDELKRHSIDLPKLEELMAELEFKTLAKKLMGNKEEKPKKKVVKAGVKRDIENFSCDGKLPQLVFSETAPALKVELQEASLMDLKTSLKKKEKTCIWRQGNQLALYQKSKILMIEPEEEGLSDLLNEKQLKYWGHDLKTLLRELKIESFDLDFDIQIAAYVYASNSIGALQDLIRKSYPEDSPNLDTATECLQAQLQLREIFSQILIDTEAEAIFYEIEMPLIPILLKMENNGILLKPKVLAEQRQKIINDLDDLTSEIYLETGEEFNIDSPKQLGKVLFEKMELPVIKKTKTGYSTDSSVLEKLSNEYPFCLRIVEYRELKKLLSTYIDALPKLIHPESLRIHSHFNQAVTATGRLSSTHPNLQNIPIRTERGNAIREAFVAPEGYLLLSVDYSQIELRVLAHITEDESLCRAFHEDLDIHSMTASEIFSVKIEQVTSDMRRKAKAINFGIAYGMGAYTLAENLKISRSEAKEIIDTYFLRFPKVQKYMKESIQKANEQSYVTSFFGRRRYIPELKTGNQQIIKMGERIAINSPIQATASEIVKKAMIAVHDIESAKMLLQVHDELIFEVKKSEADGIAKEVKTKMESVVDLKVPLKANLALASNWREAH